MKQTISSILQQARFIVDEDSYVLVKLPTQGSVFALGIIAQLAEPFLVFIMDSFEITLILSEEGYTNFANRLPTHTKGGAYKLITLDVELEPDLTGLIATLANALAQANVSILPYAAYSRDHLCVPKEDVEIALEALKRLQESFV